MNNNDIFRRLRYIYRYSEKDVKNIFSLTGTNVEIETIELWLKRDDDEDLVGLYDKDLALFLNGLIIKNRGRQEGVEFKSEKKINNNLIFRKLKIALSLKDTDIIDILALNDFKVGKSEISAFFRKPSQEKYRDCKDQILRNFLLGLKIKERGR